MTATEIRGLDEVINNLSREIKKIDSTTEKRVYKAGLHIKERSEEEVPVDQGTLINSSFIHGVKGLDGYSVIVGYNAAYAVSVHENPRSGKTGGVSPSGIPRKDFAKKGKWKFLEDPLKNNMDRILDILKGKYNPRWL